MKPAEDTYVYLDKVEDSVTCRCFYHESTNEVLYVVTKQQRIKVPLSSILPQG